MSVQKVFFITASVLLLAGCSHTGPGQQYANVAPPPPAAMPASPATSADAEDVQGNAAGVVIYEEPPRSMQTQELPPEIAEEFRREFARQPRHTSAIVAPDTSPRGILHRISSRRETPRLLAIEPAGRGHVPYRLDSGDRLRVSVYEQAELSKVYTVDGSGRIVMPLVGAIQARGRTTQAVARQIARKLARGFVKDPEVTVEVQEYRPFFIMGEVNNGGKYPYMHGMTVQTAVAVAGGYGPRAATGRALITRRIGGRLLTARVDAATPVLPGDVVQIEERWF